MGREGGKDGEGRLIRVVGSEAQDNVPHWPHHEGVPPHGHRGKSFVPHVLAGTFVGACGGLESVAVEMEGMFACVVVVEYYLYDVVVL